MQVGEASRHMLQGCTAWPEEAARRYRQQGYWANITLYGMLLCSAAATPDRVALIDDTRRVTYAELRLAVDRLAGRLIDLGFRSLDRVVFQLPNSIEFVIAFFALVKIGVIPVLALPAHRSEEISHIFAHTKAVGYVVPDVWRGYDYRSLAADVSGLAPSLRSVLVLGEPASGQISMSDLMALKGERQDGGDPAGFLPVPDEVALMLLSGGTTGLPKLIPRTHNDYVYNCRQSGTAAGFSAATVFLAVLPMAHNYTLGCPGVLGALAHGGTAVIASDAGIETIARLIETERVTVVSAAVPLIVNWLNADLAGHRDLSSLRVVMNGGAKLVPELRRRVEQRFGCTFQESFGTGEGLLNMTRLDDPPETRFTSSGRPISPADEIRIVDERGNDVADGIVGELICRVRIPCAATITPRTRIALPSPAMATTAWATWCAGSAAICMSRDGSRTSSIAAAKRSVARKSRITFWAIPRSRTSASWQCPMRPSAKRPAPSLFRWRARRSAWTRSRASCWPARSRNSNCPNG